MSGEYQQHLRSRLKHDLVNNWNYTEYIPVMPHYLRKKRFNGVRVTRSLVLCVCFVDRCLSSFFYPLCCLCSSRGYLLSPSGRVVVILRTIFHHVGYTFCILQWLNHNKHISHNKIFIKQIIKM